MDTIKCSDISLFLNSSLIGKDFKINSISELSDNQEKTVSFIKKDSYQENSSLKKLYLITETKEIPTSHVCSYIRINKPRLAFAKIIKEFFEKKQKAIIQSEIDPSIKLGKNVIIGKNCVIGKNVSIGDNSIINHNIVIHDNTLIGNNCYIKSNTTIGEDGFGFELDENNIPIRIPHLGKVIIENNVEIGASCTVARGTIKDTLLKNNVKIDDNVHIAHNCIIGENSIITAQTLLSGSVTLGKNVWLGPNSSIIQKLKIEDWALIGIGATITNDVKEKTKMMGLKALNLSQLLSWKKTYKYE